jgi:hypothetical protein
MTGTDNVIPGRPGRPKTPFYNANFQVIKYSMMYGILYFGVARSAGNYVISSTPNVRVANPNRMVPMRRVFNGAE